MPTILVIDDDPQFLLATEGMLTAAGYTVLLASSGRDAAALLEKKHSEIDLTIVDLALPDINGFELIGAISRRSSPIRVIATTGAYKDAHLEMAGTLGAHAALRKPPEGKPLPQREWLDTIRQLLDSPTRSRLANAAIVNGRTDESGTEPSKNGTEKKP